MLKKRSALYADLQTTQYHRTFVLSGELETERIGALFGREDTPGQKARLRESAGPFGQ